MSLGRLGILLSAALLGLPSRAPGQAGPAADVIAVRAGRFVDVDRGEVLRDRLIVIRGDRVEAILPGPPGHPPARKSSISPVTPSCPASSTATPT